MRVLVTCGAGFIGTQVTVAFFGAIEVVVVDDLTRGQVGPLDSRTVFSETFKLLTVEVPSAPLVTVQPPTESRPIRLPPTSWRRSP